MLLVTQTWGVGMGEAGPTVSPDQVSVARVCRYRCPEPTGLVLLVLVFGPGWWSGARDGTQHHRGDISRTGPDRQMDRCLDRQICC